MIRMARTSRSNGIFLIVLLAAVGVLLVYIPPKMLEQYSRIKALGPPWTYFYFALVGTGALILLSLVGGMLWKLWRATRAKDERLSRGAKNPSQLSAAGPQQEIDGNLAAV